MKIINKNLIIIAAAALVSTGLAQDNMAPYWNFTEQWTNSSNPISEATDCITLFNGSYVVAGRTKNQGNEPVATVRGYQRQGAFSYAHLLPGGTVTQVLADPSGTSYYTISIVDNNVYLTKYYYNGDFMWSNQTVLDQYSPINQLKIDKFNRIFMVANNVNGDRVFCVDAKTGMQKWMWGIAAGNKIVDIAPGKGNEVFVTGSLNILADDKAFIVKFNSDNGIQGTSGVWDIPDNNFGPIEMEADVNGQPYIMSKTSNTNMQSIVARYDKNTLLPTWSVSTAPNSWFNHMTYDALGGLTLVGESLQAQGKIAYVARYSIYGVKQYSLAFSPTMESNVVADFALDKFADLYLMLRESVPLTGWTRVIKVQTTGLIKWEKTFADVYNLGKALVANDASGEVLSVMQTADYRSAILATVQQSPLAIRDEYLVPKDMPFISPNSVIDNDRFVQGCAPKLYKAPMNGTLVLENFGKFTYTPNPGFVGTDTFKYKIQKGSMAPSYQTVTLTVQ